MSRHFDLLDLDTTAISNEQAGDLLIEATAEVYAALENYRRTEQNKFSEEEMFNDKPVFKPGLYRYDMEADLNRLVDVQDQMQVCSKVQAEMRQAAVEDMNDWYTRFNTWLKKSPENRTNSRVWAIYKKGLAERKAQVHKVTKSVQYQALRNLWGTLYKVSSQVVRNKDWLWDRYFALANDDIGPYFAGWDPEEIDEQQILKQDQSEVADVLGDMHVIEQSASEVDSRWSKDGLWGFWSQENAIQTLKQDWAKRHAFYEGV